MKGLNNCTFIGNVGQTPELKYTTGGAPVCKFSLAINKRWKDNGGADHEKTTWVSLVAWSAIAETINKYVKKGMPLYVEAEYDLNEYKGQDGIEKKHPQFIVRDVIFLGQKPEGRPAAAGGSTITDDDVPF